MVERLLVLFVLVPLCGCVLGEPTPRQAERSRMGTRDVHAAQRDVERQMVQHRRDLERAHRDARREHE